MKQVVQNIRNGNLSVIDVPDPIARPGHVLIASATSLISAGTEKMVMDLAKKSLLGKARQRPDQVRRVIEKIRAEGFFNTLRQVREKLDDPMPMGYCNAGVVIAAGAGVQDIKPGDRVASNGPHAGVVCVPRNLCAHIPDTVDYDHAAFAVIGAIALQGVRLSKLVLGETAFVIGLGLVGQIVVGLLNAAGVRVIGTDPDASKCALAKTMGASVAEPNMSPSAVNAMTGGLGADAVVITASTASNGPIESAANAARKKGRIVLVGVVGLELDRRQFYFKETEFVVSCSYGPGRYDSEYEEKGRDYPHAYVRWTQQRNIQAVLDLMGAGKLDVTPLISHRFPIDRADDAYNLISNHLEPYLGVVLQYPETDPAKPVRTIQLNTTPRTSGTIRFGCLGAGNFARLVMLPIVTGMPAMQPATLVSAGGLSATHSGGKLGFDSVSTDERAVFNDDDIAAVFVLTQHNQHARQVVAGLSAGKHVFVEKPLGITVDEIRDIDKALRESGESPPILMVGFNRRFSPAAKQVKDFFKDVAEPITISCRLNAGQVPADSWIQDDEIGGGRIIGEACHLIDLATFITGSPPARVYAESIGGPTAPAITDDQCFITIRHENGSISNIGYLAGGDKAYPKERVEVIGGGRIAVIDDFRRVETCSGGKRRKHNLGGQDKGHKAEIQAFVSAMTTGGRAPISWEDIRSVSLAGIFAVRSLREGVPFDLKRTDV